MLKEILLNAAAFIASLGSGGAIVWALSSYLGRIWAQKLLDKHRAELDKELEQIKKEHIAEIEKYKSELERARGDYLRFSNKKFEIIENTWSALFSIVEELKFYNKDNEDYSIYLSKSLQVITRYLTLIKKNSLYFSDEIRMSLNEYITLCSKVASDASEKIKNLTNIDQYNDIVKAVYNTATKRDSLLDEIRLKFKKEIGDIN